MQPFILGYLPDSEELTEFKNKSEADFESEEWVEVYAESLDEAKEKYETAFLNWQTSLLN